MKSPEPHAKASDRHQKVGGTLDFVDNGLIHAPDEAGASFSEQITIDCFVSTVGWA